MNSERGTAMFDAVEAAWIKLYSRFGNIGEAAAPSIKGGIEIVTVVIETLRSLPIEKRAELLGMTDSETIRNTAATWLENEATRWCEKGETETDHVTLDAIIDVNNSLLLAADALRGNLT